MSDDPLFPPFDDYGSGTGTDTAASPSAPPPPGATAVSNSNSNSSSYSSTSSSGGGIGGGLGGDTGGGGAPKSPKSPIATASVSVASTSFTDTTQQQEQPPPAPDRARAHLSSTWTHDTTADRCARCAAFFDGFNRRHHCRLCGLLFCHDCSAGKSLIPPSDICLSVGGKRGGRGGGGGGHNPQDNSSTMQASFEPDSDPDALMSLVAPSDYSHQNMGQGGGGDDSPDRDHMILYARGLEERYKLAREPLRVCDACRIRLAPLQGELRATNSNSVRFNTVDPTSVRRMFNSPLAFTLGHEVRKAAYTLNNLLPMPKRMGLLDDIGDENIIRPVKSLKETCSSVSPNLGNLDGVRIPARLLTMARGIAVLTVVKGGFGIGVEFGTGLVVARLDDRGGDGGVSSMEWSSPCAIGLGGVSWGALVGAQVSDHVFLLMTDAAVDLLSSSDGSIHLGADAAVSIGPLGRSIEGDVGVTGGAVAPIYSYSLSKGLYAGASFDGKVIFTRHKVNEKFYGYRVNPRDLLNGEVARPPAAQPLYDALKRCHVYAARGCPSSVGDLCMPKQTIDTQYRHHRPFD